MDGLSEVVNATELLMVLAALLVIGYLVVKAWHPVRVLVTFTTKLIGRPAQPGIPSEPGILEIVAQMQTQMVDVVAKVSEIHHETHRNDGSSIKDAVARIEDDVQEIRRKQAADLMRDRATAQTLGVMGARVVDLEETVGQMGAASAASPQEKEM